jgi:uncharacterized membrane protein
MDIKPRLRNYGLWVAVFALAVAALQQAGVQFVPEQWEKLFKLTMDVLILLGIISNPTTQNPGFGDDLAEK